MKQNNVFIKKTTGPGNEASVDQWHTQNFRMGGVEVPQAPRGVGGRDCTFSKVFKI